MAALRRKSSHSWFWRAGEHHRDVVLTQREFRADAGGASLAEAEDDLCSGATEVNHEQTALPEKIAAFGISAATVRKNVHDPSAIDERIEALHSGNNQAQR